MADQHKLEGSSLSNVSDGSSESTVELNIKTLDSQIYSFHVDKNITVSAFKEKIASQIGVPVGQQRLIFRGKVLKDDHLLSEYHVENGHTLHLVERQPSQSQSSSSTSTGGANTNNGSRGQEPFPPGSRNRIGQISHSVVLGTLNVGEQGEGIVPDLSRVIGTVLNSIGIGNLTGGVQPGVQFNAHVPTPQGNETEGTRSNSGTQSEAGNQAPPGQNYTGPSLPHVVQIPVGAAITIPSLNVPIPDSLNTLSAFMNRMEQALSQNADRANQSPNSRGDLPSVELPSNFRGVATPEGLSNVLRQAERLIGEHAVAALSRIAGRLEQEAGSTDPTVRGQIQTESAQVGLAMQHLGALFLELGRTILTLRMGHSPAESSVNAGPAVYISPTGPNPIMVQPFPLQTSSLFGSAAAPPNSGVFRPVGNGNIPRNVNIHIHAGTSLAPIVSAVGSRATNGEGSPGDRNNSTGSGDSGQTRVLPVRNVIATAIPSQPTLVSISDGVQPGAAVSQAPVSASLSTVISEVNSQIRNFIDTMRNEQQTSRDQSGITSIQQQSVGSRTDDVSPSNTCDDERAEEDQKTQSQSTQHCSRESTGGLVLSKEEPSTSSAEGSQLLSGTSKASEGAPQSSQGMDNSEGSPATPIGLGLGGLQPKKRGRQSRPQGKSSDGATTSNQDQSRMVGQQVLQSLASFGSRQNADIPSSGLPPHSTRGVMESISAGGQNADGQIDVANAMSQMLRSPALDGLLTGVSQQTGIGSPDVLRNMMGQLTQNPAMRNTVNQIAQQIDTHDLGSMFSGLAGGQGGGIDLGRMIQQMMPVVSQVLGGTPIPRSTPAVDSELRQSRSRRDVAQVQENSQVDLRQVARSIEQQSPPGEIFSSLVGNAVQLYNNGSVQENIVNELCNEEELANEFMEMLRQDISHRLEDLTE